MSDHRYQRDASLFSLDVRGEHPTIVAGYADETAMLWNYAGSETAFTSDHTIEDLTLGVSAVKLSEDAGKLAVATIDSTIKVYSLDGLNPMLEREITPESIKIWKMDIDAQATKCLYGTEGLILEDLQDGSTKELIQTH